MRIKDIQLETRDCVSVALDIPKDIRHKFDFVPGQHLIFKTDINGQSVRRSYSLCTGPWEDALRVAIKKVKEGLFSTYANDSMKVGDEIEISVPQGSFNLHSNPEKKGLYVFFAAGSGITPVMSMVKAILHDEPMSKVMLFYGNKTSDNIIFKEPLEDLKNEYLDRMVIHFIFSQEKGALDLFNGRIDAEKCKYYARVFFNPLEVDNFYLCGPEQMIMEVKEELTRLNVDKSRLHYELFVSSKAKQPQKRADGTVSEQKTGQARVVIILDGDEYPIMVDYNGKSILERAIEEDIDVPFSCQSGVCCTCKAQLLEGQVHIEEDHALEDDEKEAGFILSCQASPRSPELRVDFDV